MASNVQGSLCSSIASKLLPIHMPNTTYASDLTQVPTFSPANPSSPIGAPRPLRQIETFTHRVQHYKTAPVEAEETF